MQPKNDNIGTGSKIRKFFNKKVDDITVAQGVWVALLIAFLVYLLTEFLNLLGGYELWIFVLIVFGIILSIFYIKSEIENRMLKQKISKYSKRPFKTGKQSVIIEVVSKPSLQYGNKEILPSGKQIGQLGFFLRIHNQGGGVIKPAEATINVSCDRKFIRTYNWNREMDIDDEGNEGITINKEIPPGNIFDKITILIPLSKIKTNKLQYWKFNGKITFLKNNKKISKIINR